MKKNINGQLTECVMISREVEKSKAEEHEVRKGKAAKSKRYVCWLCDADCGSKFELLLHLNAHRMAVEQQIV